MDDPHVVHHVLGCSYSFGTATATDGTVVSVVTEDMERFFRTSLEAYEEAAAGVGVTEVQYVDAITPFIDEDDDPSPSRDPVAGE